MLHLWSHLCRHLCRGHHHVLHEILGHRQPCQGNLLRCDLPGCSCSKFLVRGHRLRGLFLLCLLFHESCHRRPCRGNLLRCDLPLGNCSTSVGDVHSLHGHHGHLHDHLC